MKQFSKIEINTHDFKKEYCYLLIKLTYEHVIRVYIYGCSSNMSFYGRSYCFTNFSKTTQTIRAFKEIYTRSLKQISFKEEQKGG